MSGFLRSPSLPVAILLAIAPGVAVAQFRTMAPMVPVALLLAVVAHWRNHRALPWPRLTPVLGLSLALAGWGAISALWSIEAARGAETALLLGALVFLGAAAARALEEDAAENRRRIGLALAIGLVIGVGLLAFDNASQNLFRRAVRGFPEWTVFLTFGLKPAVSVLGLLLPLVLAAPVPRAAQFAILVAGLAVSLWLPGESAKIAALAGVVASLSAMAAPRLVARASAAVLALVFLAAPVLFAAGLARVPDLSPVPFSAAHRILIWDFVTQRIAERPLLGWGMEASRSIPGGTETFDRATLDRFGLDSPAERGAFASPSAQRLPLHTHNNALQLWLELGGIGSALAAALAVAVMLAAAASPIAPAALGAAVAGAVTGQLSFGAWQPWWLASLVLVAVVVRGLSTRR